MFNLFKKKEVVVFNDTDIVSPVNGQMINIENVNDPIFSQKMMGDGVAFKVDGNQMTVVSPANGELSVLFPTGHAFGVTMKNGIELLVHIGIDTVSSGGKGFKVLNKKQGIKVKAGEEIIRVDLKQLKEKYDMTTMLIVTNTNNQNVTFVEYKEVSEKEIINI